VCCVVCVCVCVCVCGVSVLLAGCFIGSDLVATRGAALRYVYR